MKYLGIDFGSKRVGMAVSDEAGQMAFPYSVLQNNENLLNEAAEIIKKEKIEEIVMGESKDFKNEPNKIMKKIEEFKKNLEDLPAQAGKLKIKVWLEPEFMTSKQANIGFKSRRLALQESGSRLKRREQNSMHDASAAAIILQSYLDKRQDMI